MQRTPDTGVPTPRMRGNALERDVDPQDDSEVLAAFSDALYDLYRHAGPETLGQAVVAVIPRAIACDSAVFVHVEPTVRAFTLVSWPPDHFVDIDHNATFALHARDHPLVAHFLSKRDARAWSLHDFVTPAEFRRTALYRSLYRKLGIEFQLAILIPFPDRSLRILALNRSGAPFAEHERSVLQLFWPHLTQVVRRSRATRWRRGQPDTEEFSPEQAILILDEAGRAALCTEQARVWLARYCAAGTTLRMSRPLPEPLAGWISGTLGDQTLKSRGIPGPATPLFLRKGDAYLALRFVADHARGQHLVLLNEVKMHAPPDLLLGLGLTPREAEVLAWIAQGKTNRETGLILEMSPRTVQKHLERVFDKLGVESRTGAILKAWQTGPYEDAGLRPPSRPGRGPVQSSTRPSNRR